MAKSSGHVRSLQMETDASSGSSTRSYKHKGVSKLPVLGPAAVIQGHVST